MKRYIILVLLIALLFVFLIGCGETQEVDTVEEEPSIVEDTPLVYEYNDVINLFINNYNTANADDIIEPEMIKKDVINGYREVDDQVVITDGDNGEIILSDRHPFMVMMQLGECENDYYKQLVLKYIKGFDPSISDELIEECWTKATMDGSSAIVKYDEFELNISTWENKIQSVTIYAEVKKQ